MRSHSFKLVRVQSALFSGPLLMAAFLMSGCGGGSPVNLTATPSISLAAGTYTSVQTVTVSDLTPGATIYYTTNGITPLPISAASVLYNGPISISGTQTITAQATAQGLGDSVVATAAFTINLPPAAATPTITPAAGTYTSVQSVAISDTTSGAKIYYTIDGSTPTTSSTLYSGPIAVTSSVTIKAIAAAANFSNSAVASAVYVINLPPVAATPTIAPAAGTYTSVQTVTITDTTPGVSVHYTITGSAPTMLSTLYSGPITVSSTETINAIATGTGFTNSSVATAAYTINLPVAAAPAFSLPAGTYNSDQTLTVTDSTAGATIHYTLDGSTPTAGSALYTGPISVSTTETIKAIAVASGYTNSPVTSALYTLNLPAAASPLISLPAATYTTIQSVTLTDATPGASMYYTLDGTTPTTLSTLYSAPITLVSSATLKAIASAPNFNNSPVASAAYVLNVPTLTGKVMSGTQTVSNAAVQLYAVGSTGYTSAALPLLSKAVASGTDGSFSLTGKYNCTPGTYLYMTASGGVPGSASTSNPNLALMAVVGLCDNLSNSLSVTLNEITTVAGAYALAHFAQGTTFGQTLENQPGSASTAPADNFATSSTNLPGLANAMAIAGLLADSTTGSSPGNNSNKSASPEWWQVNLIANMLAACGSSGGGSANDGSACGILFGHVHSSGAAPADMIQAALALALDPTVPSSNISSLYDALILPAPGPFQPYASAASSITDFSIGIEYQPVAGATPLLNQPSGVAIDSLGNAWIGNQPTGTTVPPPPGYLVELTTTGVPIQAGSAAGNSPGNYEVNGYMLGGVPTAMGGQYISTGGSAGLEGLFVPSIDTNNNIWIADRTNSVIAMVPGSGTTYSTGLSYQNGGNTAATGYPLNAGSDPSSTYVDGNNSVWFNTEGVTRVGSCQAGLGTNNGGIGAFLNGDTGNIYYGKNGNEIGSANAGYLVVDPNVSDEVAGTAIPGAPFIWTIGIDSGFPATLQSYTQATLTSSFSASTAPSCFTPLGAIGVAPETAAGDTSSPPAHNQSAIVDIPNPALSGDFLHYISNSAQDWAFDKFGSFWVANKNQINTTTTATNEILSSISKITPAYGAAFTNTATSNFTFTVYHNVAGMFDGSTVADYPAYLTIDGGGNAWFALSSNRYVNALSGSGAALSPNSGTANTTAGFAGSTCSNCTFNGVKATYQRPNTLAISRPAVDQSGNVWVPVSGSGSNYLDLLVGIATPKVAPDSVGLKSGNFASQP